MKRKSNFHAFSELLALLNERYKLLGLGDGGTHRKPNHYASLALDRAATDHAKAHPSDPFAHGRILLHMRNGYELVSDVQADATRILQVADAARRARFPEQVPA